MKFLRGSIADRIAVTGAVVTAVSALALGGVAEGGAGRAAAPLRALPTPVRAEQHQALERIRHIVVVFEENHSFDNLYGGWEGVRGLRSADAAHTAQVAQAGAPYACLKQDDVNLTTPPLPASCHDTVTATPFDSAFRNEPFQLDAPDLIPPEATTCPGPGTSAANGLAKGSGLPGGCTRDLVHRYYQEQYELNGGRQNRYVTGSDAIGLTMGYYDTRKLPVYRYLHTRGHPRYAIADDFFQGAFGGSFLNHQWLVAARTPVFNGAPNDGSASDLHSVVDSGGMPVNYPLYASPAPSASLKDQVLTASCAPGPGRGPTPAGVTCGDYAVNTIQPPYQPFAPGTPVARRLPPQTVPTIGDRLSAANVGWAWYSGGWSNANGDVGGLGWTNGSAAAPATATNPKPCPDANASSAAQWPNCPDKLFQFHHQALNYYAQFAPGTPARAEHLRDETEFTALATGSARSCGLRSVSFVKPVGEENEHPGYASEARGSDHLVDLLKAVEDGACARDTMVVVTYDEFGGSWDHVPPPGQGGAPGPHDVWGPGTRIPALILAPHLRGRFVVDHSQYDTTSILSTIERRYGLPPLGSRDRDAGDLAGVFSARRPRGGHRGG